LDVNGSGTARFLLDTGGGELILDQEFAGRVGAVGFGAERGIFGGGRKARVEHGRVDSVRLGGFVLRNVPVAVLDLEAVAPTVGEARLDGILGTVPLSRFTSTIDYLRGALVLERASEEPTPGGSSVPFWLAGDHFVVAWGAVNGGPETLFFVDTGLAGNGFTCPSSTLREARIEVQEELAEEARALGSGAFRVAPFVVDELRLGEFRRQRVDGVAGAFPPQLERGLGFRVGGLISHQFFRSCALTLDFAAMRLRLQRAGSDRDELDGRGMQAHGACQAPVGREQRRV
jgi:predicted aspartyl protease